MSLGLTSFEFVFILPIIIMFYYWVPAFIRQYYILVFNILFYCSFGYQYVVVVAIEALIAWVASAHLSKNKNPLDFSGGCCHRKGKTAFIVSIALLIVILFFFKLGIKISSSIVAPLGISFYTLQAISYIADVYRRKVEAERNPVKLLIYLSFFPTITSGPIYRYGDFIKCHDQNITSLKADYNRITSGILYILYGYFLKLVIAERAAIPVNKVFEEFEPEIYGGAVLAIVAVTYSIQIYADFAGYSAIVIGIAQVIGYDIPENFCAPYFSRSIKEFWTRWHVSLSSWLRDYIYIPLGGNRRGKLRKYINLLLTFLISGFWHGGGLHFIAWGIIHGMYQIIGDMISPIKKKLLKKAGIVENSLFHRFINRSIVFILVTVAWIFFRTGVKDALKMIVQILISPHPDYMISGKLWELGLSPAGWIILGIAVLLMGCVDFFTYNGIRVDKAIKSQGALAGYIYVATMALTILILGIYGDSHDTSYFVYRDF